MLLTINIPKDYIKSEYNEDVVFIDTDQAKVFINKNYLNQIKNDYVVVDYLIWKNGEVNVSLLVSHKAKKDTVPEKFISLYSFSDIETNKPFIGIVVDELFIKFTKIKVESISIDESKIKNHANFVIAPIYEKSDNSIKQISYESFFEKDFLNITCTSTEYSIDYVFKHLALRYNKILSKSTFIDIHLGKCSDKNLLWMTNKIIHETFPEDKTSRWIGFIQGCLSMKGYITVDEERDYSRPLFSKYYNDCGIVVPQTQEMN